MWPVSNSSPTSAPTRAISASTSAGVSHVGAHVMVVGEAHAVRERVLRERASGGRAYASHCAA